MSLPPDPHDDDLTGTYPEVGGRGPSGPPPPPPPVPPPGSPVTDDVTPLANAAAALGRDLGRAGASPAADGPPAPPAPPHADPGDGSSASGGPPARRRGLVLAAAGVAAAVVVAGVVFALAGGDDEPTATGDDAAAADAPAGADDAGASGGEATDSGSGGGEGNGDGDGSSGGASGDGITDNSGESPVEAAEAMFTAAIAGDCQGVVARMTPEAYAPDGETPAEAVAECEADLDRNELLGAELRDVSAVSEDGDAAVVSVTLAIGDDTGTQDVPLVRLDDGWKVDIAQ